MSRMFVSLRFEIAGLHYFVLTYQDLVDAFDYEDNNFSQVSSMSFLGHVFFGGGKV